MNSRFAVFRLSLAQTLALLLGALLIGLTSGCDAPQEPIGQGPFPMRLGAVNFTAELALTPEEMTTGLMHRAELPPNQGMLFIYPEPGRRSFWMKNTHIPLDVGFFTADGVLQEIRPLTPYDLTAVPSSRSDILYALEMPRGWFSHHQLTPGAVLDLEKVQEARSARAATP